MIVPVGATSFSHALRMCAEVFMKLKEVLRNKGLSTNTGDEGGFAPDVSDNESVLVILLEAIERAGYKPSTDVALALDVAASTFFDGSSYNFNNSSMSSSELISYYEDLVSKYPIISIEDAMAEDDFSGWISITQRLNHKIQLVGLVSHFVFALTYEIYHRCRCHAVRGSLHAIKYSNSPYLVMSRLVKVIADYQLKRQLL